MGRLYGSGASLDMVGRLTHGSRILSSLTMYIPIFSVTPHMLSAFPPLINLPRGTQTVGSAMQRRASNMGSSIISIHYRDGSINSIAVRDKKQVINVRTKLMTDGWMVMQNQTFLDGTVEQRQIKHNEVGSTKISKQL